jgi:ssDNA-binding Zn-finger/Zn-ribbon topoisomerase 1
MPRDRRIVGECPRCGQGKLACSYNLFQAEALRIDSWEHKCPDCGHRETKAFRSDAEGAEGLNPEACPFCGRRAGQAEA